MLIPYDRSKLFTMVDLINTVNNEKELISTKKDNTHLLKSLLLSIKRNDHHLKNHHLRIHFDVYLFILHMILISHKYMI